MAAKHLKCLFVTPSVPFPPDTGGRVRTYHLLRELHGRAEVHLRAVHESPAAAAAIAELAPHCASVRGFERARAGTWRRATRAKLERWFFSPALAASIGEELARERYDLVHLDEMFMIGALRRNLATAVIVHHHKLDTRFYDSLPSARTIAGRFDSFKLQRLEREAARRHRFHVLTGEADARELKGRYPALHTSVVESGFHPPNFLPTDSRRSCDDLIFLGSLDYGPNIDGLTWFVREVMPILLAARPGTRLRIVGSGNSAAVQALAGRSVSVVGRVETVGPELGRAALLIAPLRIGGGTRLKIVEALGSETPVVSTRIGAEGLGFEDPKHLWLADGAPEFAARTLEALADPSEARARARRGRALAMERYTWSVLSDKLLATWRRASGRDSDH